jgi:C4-dicarboxylate-specific signal transduction histidine kinase
VALPAPSLPIGTHRLGLRLLAAIVIASTCLALATTAVLLALDDRLGKAPAILAATTAGTLVVALFIALVGRWVTRHLEHMARHARGPSLEVLVERRTAELQRANDDLVLTNKRLEQAQTQLVQPEKMASIG